MKPFVNKVQLLYPNFQPVLLNLPNYWRNKPLKFLVGTRNRCSALLSSLDSASFAERYLEDKESAVYMNSRTENTMACQAPK